MYMSHLFILISLDSRKKTHKINYQVKIGLQLSFRIPYLVLCEEQLWEPENKINLSVRFQTYMLGVSLITYMYCIDVRLLGYHCHRVTSVSFFLT